MTTRTHPCRVPRQRETTDIKHHGDPETRRRFVGRSAWALLLMVSIVPASAAGPEFKDVRIAGTFNNWTTNDDAYCLKLVPAHEVGVAMGSSSCPVFRGVKVPERWELTRFWPCGEYQFKFVFDGTWDKHLGDAGGGKLGQPGENIKLAIPQSGGYTVWLDIEKKEWGTCELGEVSRPHAVITVYDEICPTVVLDARVSLEQSSLGIPEYRWSIGEESTPQTDTAARTSEESSLQYDSCNRVVRVPRALLKAKQGQVGLVIDDGAKKSPAKVVLNLTDGWLLSENGQRDAGAVMFPIGPDVWGRTVKGGPDGMATLEVLPMDVGDGKPVATARSATVKGRDYLAKYDGKRKSLSLLDEGWREFVWKKKESKGPPRGPIVERVELVGDFNDWQTGRTPMFSTEEGEVWHRILEIPDGVYHYKILVNGCIWLEDPNADPQFREPDNRGGFNSGVLVGLDGTKLGPAKPDHLNSDALKHDPANGKYLTPIAKNLVVLTLRTLANDVQAVDVIRPGTGPGVAMRRVDSQFGFDYWSAQILTGAATGSRESAWTTYAFRLTDGSEHAVFGRKGVAADANDRECYFRLDAKMEFQTPDWAKTAVWYQIFPERFRNGDPKNDPPRTVPWTHEWFKPYQGRAEVARKDSRTSENGDFVEEGKFYSYIFNRRYGGDIQGIQEKLPYLRDLGVTAIYLNPVFIAESLHKYDASDYRHIDDFFGVKDSLTKINGETTDPATWKWSESDRVFLDFIKEAHRQGFKVIIDGVFNHVGRDFWAFKDVVKNGKDSPYAGWFEIKSWEPFHYVAWDGDDGHLPKLKHDEAKGLAEPIREHLFAVTRRWMDPNGDGDPSDGIDGWRLDVASDINANFWSDWRKLVKSINPDAYIVAELWEESRSWLDGKTFDAVMNYPFARACQKFFVNKKKTLKPTGFDKQLRENLAWYVPQVNYVLQNLLNSHDTDRASSMFMNPDLEYDKADRLQDNGPNYNPNRPTPDCYHKLKLEVMFQMAFLGAPMFYYGDEVGMYGADDPSCRKPMYWEDLMPYDDPDERIVPGLRDHYRRMIAIRNTYPALQLGSFETLLMNDSLRMYAFARTLGNDTIVIVLNNSDKPHKLNVPVSWPTGSKIVRLDDPAECEIVGPPADQPKARPTVRPIDGHKPTVKVVDGKLKGIRLEPRTGAMFRLAE
ncbi:MAG TPA: alpha amylase N-terminal ig-like domain-containing protein [Phycisphaerae bacterium]|nr:alpha amylase N-terminal ig-like domain-containing protein [Phycisphaerae bacterium]